ncbi:hypothetical protein N7519_006031 [Penicillium mononematosum]|uniref:uncharacterized protein n=1 Tax=Penicillium mononematosum TaxID=268346 RepID=UPI0025483193|nr:uncharacterized protein N7519_006031 [Penicillium mononematosum]KAJ6184730.1 hypothetical protein N7519_006031 [Penicillium mononematosum]
MSRKQPIYEIGPFISSADNTDTQLNVHACDKLFKIDLFTSSFENSPLLLAEYLCHVRRQEPEWILDGSETWEFEDPLEEMHDWILQPFLPIFRELGSLDPSRKYTLEDCLFAEELHYTVQVVENKVVPVYLSNTKNMKHHLHCQEYLASLRGDARITAREILTYSKIRMAKFDSPILTSQLEGLVQDDDGLNCIDGRDPKYSGLRHKWVDQVSHTLKQFHSHNIIWGDAKAANVLVDVNNDAYLIDFGGGYTQGWVEKEKSNSVEGDLQGLENIKRFLQIKS